MKLPRAAGNVLKSSSPKGVGFETSQFEIKLHQIIVILIPVPTDNIFVIHLTEQAVRIR